MARVNHKKIKQLIAQKQKTITDRQFFASRALAAYFEDIAAAQTRRYGYRRRVKVSIVWKPKESGSARTDNGLIWINAGHPSVTMHKTRQARYEQVCGLFGHELGHVLYTDFLTSQTYHRFQESGKWYPEPPPLRSSRDRNAETEYFELLQSDPKCRKVLGLISHDILNVLEDGYIEQRMITDYPGILGANLEIRRESTFEVLPTVTQMTEQEEDGGHIWLTVLQCILAYMKWGRIKYGETPLTDERIQSVFSLLGDLDTALTSQDFRDRCRTANIVLIRCWPYIKNFVDYCKDIADQAAEVSGDLLHISKQLQKSVLQQMHDSRRGGKQTGLLMGRRLDIHALSRNDGRVFYKNALPNEIPALSVGLLLDESGSMCSCDRATYARATAIILYDFCQALGIPIMVYGHSTGSGVDLYSYAEFDAIDRDDRYRMMDISARGSNRDGAALRYVAEQLSQRSEDVKLLMLVSDGQPADTDYYGTAAEEDLRGVKQEYQRKGILFVAAAIGSDKENIERIYGDSFLDISDQTKLPVKLAGIIKRFIRV